MAIQFDLEAARRDGFSDDQILNGLAKKKLLDFDYKRALDDGYSSTDILQKVVQQPVIETPKPQEPSSILGRAGDVGIGLAKGVIGLPESLVGLADIPTGGAVGKGLESIGVRFGQAKEYLNEFLSPEQIAANKAVADSKGFLPTIKASIENPSTILQTAAESAPSMIGGAGIARGIGKTVLGGGLSAVARGAIGEGVISAGQAAESIRQQTQDGELSLGQSAAAAVSGGITGLINLIGGRFAKKLGIDDIDTLLAGRAAANLSAQEARALADAERKSIARRIIEGGFSEGVLEELPQSAQEQVFQNAALGKPLLEGVEEAAAQGLLVGAAMGAGANIRKSAAPIQEQVQQEPQQQQDILQLENRPSILISFPDGSVGTQADLDNFIASLPEEERIPQRARLMGLGEQAIKPEQNIENILSAETIDSAIESAQALIDVPTETDTKTRNSEIDQAWMNFAKEQSAKRQEEFMQAQDQVRAEQAAQILEQTRAQNVEQAEALTQAQGFDEPGKTAMQLAFERAQQLQNREITPLKSFADEQGQFIDKSGLTVADIESRIQPLRDKFKGFQSINVIQSINEIPQDIQSRLRADSGTEGFFDPKTNEVYLIADALSTPERAAFVLSHEVIGHGGLRLLNDRSVTQALQFASGNKFVKELARAISSERVGNAEINSNSIEEAIAELSAAIETDSFSEIERRYRVTIPASAQNGIRGAVSRVIQNLKTWFAKLIGKPIEEITDAQIRSMISSQQAAVYGMNTQIVAGQDYVFQSRAENKAQIEVDGVMRPTQNSKGQLIAQTEDSIQKFWRWFGESKVVDDQGRPLVVYHGNSENFNEFDKSYVGTSGLTKTGKQKLFWFTDNPDNADSYIQGSREVRLAYRHMLDSKTLTQDERKDIISRYAAFEGGNIIPVYLKIENPIEKDGKGRVSTNRDFAAKAIKNIDSGENDGGIIFNTRDFSADQKANKHFFVSESSQIKSVLGNTGEFSPESDSILQSRRETTERIPKWAEGYSDREKEILRKTGAIYREQTWQDKLKEMRTELGMKLKQGILDQYAPIKDRLSAESYMLARMSKASDQVIEAMMMYGRPVLEDGAVNIDRSKPGLIEILSKLNGEHERFFQWVAGRRARELKSQGRENLLTNDDISFLSDLNSGQMKDGSSRAAAYSEALASIQIMNNAVLDIAEQSGLIDRESRKEWQSEFYVPFYRVVEEGTAGPTIKGGLINQQSIKRLKGGTQNLSDLMGNMQKNWQSLLAGSAKNRAARAVLTEAVEIGASTESNESTVRQMAKQAQAKVVSYLDNGNRRWFVVDDDPLFAAISAIEFNGYNNGPMKVMGAFKNMLTKAVTAAPGFKFVRNPIRDAIASIAISDKLGWNPIANFKQGVSILRDDDSRAALVAGGGMIRFGSYLEGNRAEYLKKILDRSVPDETILSTPEKIKDFLERAWDKYNELGDYGENFNRAAVYARMRQEGKSHLEASFEARDMMDFGLSGAWSGVRALNQILPFFNARLQGGYKLARSASQNPARVAKVIGALTVASIAIMLANKDDEDWKKRTDADKNNYWWFKVDGTAYRIPKPFEIGAAVSAIENLTALWLDSENTNAKRFASQLGDIVSSQLSMNLMPQIVRPFIDVYSNKDAFTGQPIESLAMQRLRPQDREDYNTSEIARALGATGVFIDPISFVSGTGVKQLSPLQIDSLIKGYFSSVGMIASSLVDAIARKTVVDRGESLPVPIKTLTLGIAEKLPNNTSIYFNSLYEAASKIEQTYASMQNAIKMGDVEYARKIMAENREKIALYPAVERVKKIESLIGQQIKIIRNSKTLSGEEKEQRINELKQRQSDVAKSIYEKIK